MRKYIIGFLIQFVSASISAIAGLILLFYLDILLVDFVGLDLSLILGTGDKTGVFLGIFVGAPLGAALGVFIAQRFILKKTKINILIMVLASVCAFAALLFL